MIRLILSSVFAVLMAVCAAGGAVAQVPGLLPGAAVAEPAAAPQEIPPPDPADLQALARLLEDQSLVAWLTAQLEEDAAAETGTLGLGERLRGALQRLEENLARTMEAYRILPQTWFTYRDEINEQLGTGNDLRFTIYAVIFLVVGGSLEWLYWQQLGRRLRRLEGVESAGPWTTFVNTQKRMGLRFGGIAMFSLGSIGTFLMFEWRPLAETMVLTLLGSILLVRFALTVSGFVLAPWVPSLRLVPVTDRFARTVHLWITALALMIAWGLSVNLIMREVGGPGAPAWAAADIMMTAIALMFIGLFWLAPRAWPLPEPTLEPVVASVSPVLAEGDPGEPEAAEIVTPEEAAAESRDAATEDDTPVEPKPDINRRSLPILPSVMVAFLWVLWIVDGSALFQTVLTIVLLPFFVKVAWFLGGDPFRRRVEERRMEQEATGVDAPAPIDFLSPIFERIARFVVIVVGLLLIDHIWEVRDGGPFEGTIIETVAEASVDLLVAFLIAELLWTWAKTAIDSRMARFQPNSHGAAPGSEARLATLLPILRKTLMVLLVIMVTMIGLSSLGVNIGPLLAGAGVIGIAVGFGAQTLVRDIFSGIFFLIDDAFRVGEYIEIDQLRGTVEGISIRSMKLRHHRGAVHTIPFGELKSLTNYSRDWVIMKLEFRVPFETDLGLVKKLVKNIGKELSADPILGPQFLEPVKSQGVRRMEEFNMVIGVKFMTRPGEQWVIRREVYQRIRDTFEAHGIHFAQRNVKVEVVGAGDGAIDEETKKAAVGAAQDAIERQAGVGAPA